MLDVWEWVLKILTTQTVTEVMDVLTNLLVIIS